MTVILLIFKVVFVRDGAIDHYPRAFDNKRKTLTPKLSFEPLWFSSDVEEEEKSGFYTAFSSQCKETQARQVVNSICIHELPASKISWTGFRSLRTVRDVFHTRIKSYYYLYNL